MGERSLALSSKYVSDRVGFGEFATPCSNSEMTNRASAPPLKSSSILRLLQPLGSSRDSSTPSQISNLPLRRRSTVDEAFQIVENACRLVPGPP